MNKNNSFFTSFSSSFQLLALSFLFTFSACKTGLHEEEISAGNADFSRYVAVGNSLTSGYTDDALYLNGQKNSFPVMLANQFELVGGGAFKVPYMDAGGGSNIYGNPRMILGFTTKCGDTVPSLSPISDPNGATPFGNVSAYGPYNLIGVPGARAIDCNFNLYSNFNPFLQRFCLVPGVSTMLSEAKRINPTFFTLWLGSNDVLLYATGGSVFSTDILAPRLTDTSSLRLALQQAVDTLTINGAKGAIANIPDVTAIPYFTTIPWNSVVLTQAQADALNPLYAGTNITWHEGKNGLVIVDSTYAPTYIRQANMHDYILLSTPSDSLRCGQWGVHPLKPLSDKYVLDSLEVAEVKLYTQTYNQTIANIASAKNLALVDINSYFKTFISGIIFNGIKMNASYISGGAFSLDGVHPNARGYALIANEFIRSINAKYSSNIPMVNAGNYPGIVFP